MIPAINIPKLHSEYCQWVSELDFCKEEIGLFETRLQHLAPRKKEVLDTVYVERFQNRFILQKEVIDKLKHKLGSSEKQLAAMVKSLSGLGLTSIAFDDHSQLRQEFSIFQKLYAVLKEDFRQFGGEDL